MDNLWDAIDLAISAYRDKVTSEIRQRLKEEYFLTLEAEADARRSKVANDILRMAKLKNELTKFQFTYNLVKSKTGEIKAIEDMIRNITLQIKCISSQKNRSYKLYKQ